MTDEHMLFKSLSSQSRIAMLKNLQQHPLSYTELMKAVGMAKKTASGKFAHHIRVLMSSGLVRLNPQTKAYELTPKGVKLMKSLENLRSVMLESDRLKVRRSGLFIEKFDRNKIANVLVEEANVPPKTADNLAKLAEEKLEDLNIEYLTAPLIRELVNALLIDQGLEQYRHRLTRLGMPVYDVEKLLADAAGKRAFPFLVKSSSDAVFREYVLQSALPREVVDAYLAGDIDLRGVNTWAFSVSSKILNADSENMLTVLTHFEGVESEIVVRTSSNPDAQTLRFLAKYLAAKQLKLTFYSESFEMAFAQSVLDSGLQLMVPFEKLDFDHRSLDLILPQRPASSDGHPFSASGLIDGEASLNLVGLYLKAGGVEKIFWDNVRSAIDAVFHAFKKKKSMVSRFWEDVQGYFILSFVGMTQLVERGGFNQAELVGELSTECKRTASDEVLLLPSPQSTAKTAERFRHLDVIRFGAKKVEQLAGPETYSWRPAFPTVDEILYMAKHLPGGFKIAVAGKQAAKLLDLKPLALLSSSPKSQDGPS
ncbi:MAG: winged helix-turn-helix domain-containing protein [Candidatus Caldarchaeum sp.]